MSDVVMWTGFGYADLKLMKSLSNNSQSPVAICSLSSSSWSLLLSLCIMPHLEQVTTAITIRDNFRNLYASLPLVSLRRLSWRTWKPRESERRLSWRTWRPRESEKCSPFGKRGDKWNRYKILIQKPKGSRSFGRSREIKCTGLKWMHLAMTETSDRFLWTQQLSIRDPYKVASIPRLN
jgi:hypothetical protein